LLQHATFPQAPALETAPALTEQPGNGGERLAGLRLLIIEDNEVNRLMLEEILRQEGAWLLSAGNGREAMDILQQRGTDAFDLVLTDVQMPVMDGYEFARQAHHLAPGLPVVGLTAHALSEERSRCIAAGMVEQLTKPVDIDRLVQVLLHFTLSSPSPVSPSPALQAQPVPSPVEAPVAKATEASTDSAGDPRIDWAVLAERYNAKHDFLLKLAETLRHTYGAAPTRIAALIEHRDLSNLAFLAHSLKGMGSNMAAPGLHAIALQTEQAAKQGSEETFALALRLSDAMRVLMDDLDQRFPANIPAP
jgi:CheY-like chemotaxis protein